MTIKRAISLLLTTLLFVGCAKKPQTDAPVPQPASPPTAAAIGSPEPL